VRPVHLLDPETVLLAKYVRFHPSIRHDGSDSNRRANLGVRCYREPVDPRTLSHVLAFDDAPFERAHRGDVLVVGAAFAGLRIEGIVSTKVRRDGVNSTRALAEVVSGCKFHPHVVLLNGIALAGFNVVDIHRLHDATGVPVVVVMRRLPRLEKVRRALLDRTPGGARKWRLVEQAGPPEPASGVFVQRAGLDLPIVAQLVRTLAVNGSIPEPLRLAHLVAGGVVSGESRGRA
jgi:endonuclease V-like protein UPF0215 family